MARTGLFSRQHPGGVFTVEDVDEHPGDIFFVDSGAAGAGDSTGKGKNPDYPYATIDYAIGQATADQGDVIYVLPGHAETLAADITVDKADLKIIGLGNMGNRPTLTFGAAAREINVTADDVILKNLKLVSGANDLVNFIDADANSLVLEDLWMETSAGAEALCFIDFATTKDNLILRRCHARQPSDPEGTDGNAGMAFLYWVDTENILVEDCTLIGNFETAIFHNKTTAGKDLWIRNTYLRQELNGAEHFIMVDGQTGGIQSSIGQNANATDVTVAKIVGTIGTQFWLSGDTFFGNDSGGGGQLMVVGDAATT
jgi:hypothetical protein